MKLINLRDFLFLFYFIFSSTFVLANSVPNCDRALQIESPVAYLSRAQEEVSKQLQIAPHPKFVDLKEDGAIVRKGAKVPGTLKKFLTTQPGLKIEALATPSLNTEHPAVVARFKPGTGFSAHLELTLDNGQVVTTQAYINMPLLLEKDQLADDSYLFSPSKGHKLMFLHGHGGGTRHAGSSSGSSVANPLVKNGIPAMSVDQHLHGKGPNSPLLSYDEKIEYNLSILEKTVHPDVKIILSGHSWGGEDLMYFYAQYLPKHRDKNGYTGRFKRVLDQIVGLMPLSPPVDVTMGTGVARERIEIEEELGKKAKQPQANTLIAEKDLEFNKNKTRHGKSSLTAVWATTITQIFLSLSIPDEELKKQLPQLKIYMGKYDGLVFVFREFAFEPWQEFLSENFVLMDTLLTIKKEDGPQKTGHQTMDSLDSEGRPIVFSGMLAMAQELLGEEINEIQPDPRSRTDIIASLHRILIYYMNIFPAREFFNNRKVAVTQKVGKAKELSILSADLNQYMVNIGKLKEKSKSLYLEALGSEVKKLGNQFNIRGRAAGGLVEAAYLELQMAPPSDERKSRLQNFIERAKKIDRDFFKSRVFEEDILSRPKIQEILKKENEKYQTLYKHTKNNLKPDEVFNGPTHIEDIGFRIFELDEARMAFKNLVGGAGKIENPQVVYSEIIARYNLALMHSGARSLAGFDPNSVNDMNVSQIEALAERGIELIELENEKIRSFFESPAAFVRESNKILERVLQALKQLKKDFNKKTQEETLRLISEIDPELGVGLIKDAEWELSIDFSDQGRQRLHDFLAEVEKEKTGLEKTYQMELTRSLAKHEQANMPEGYTSTGEIEAKISEIAAMTKGQYIPRRESAESLKIKKLVERSMEVDTRLKALSDRKAEFLKVKNKKDLHEGKDILNKKDLHEGKDTLNKMDLLERKDTLLRQLDALYSGSLVAVGSEDWPNGVMPFWWPYSLKMAVDEREISLDQWKKIEASLSKDITDYLLEKYEAQGQFYPEDFTEIPSHIAEKTELYRGLMDQYFIKKNRVLDVFFKLMREGAFQVEPNKSSGVPDFTKAQEHIQELLGETKLDSDTQYDPNSIEGKLRIVEAKLFDLAQEEAVLDAERKEINNEYYLLMSQIEKESLVKSEEIIDVSYYLNLGFDELRELLEAMTEEEVSALSLALSNAVKDWEDIWKPALIESELAKPDWYPLYPEYYRAASGLGKN